MIIKINDLIREIKKKNALPVVDISRLHRKLKKKTPTGIERLEVHFIKNMLEANLDVFGIIGPKRNGKERVIINTREFKNIIEIFEKNWSYDSKKEDYKNAKKLYYKIFFRRILARTLPKKSLKNKILRTLKNDGLRKTPIYINFSPSGLLKHQNGIETIKNEISDEIILYCHDIIPIEYPEYSGRRQTDFFQNLFPNLTRYKSRVICNSIDTMNRLNEYILNKTGAKNFSKEVLYPEIDWIDTSRQKKPKFELKSDFFVIIGSLTERKNHLLLFYVWREMIRSNCDNIPHLYIIGNTNNKCDSFKKMYRENDNIKKYVHMCGNLSQPEMIYILKRSKALLIPSFAEGLCLPIIEAGSMGVPIIASNLEVFKEKIFEGYDIKFADPLNANEWKEMILKECKATK